MSRADSIRHARHIRLAVPMIAVALTACARQGPPAPVVDRSGIYYTSPARATPPVTPAPRTSVSASRLPAVKPPPRPEPVQTQTLAAPQQTNKPVNKPVARAAAPGDDEVTRPAGGAPSPSGASGTVTGSGGGTVTVQAGDTLFAVSRREKVPVRALIDANGLKPPYPLRRGQRLRVPGVRVYVVAGGDTVYGVSRRFDLGIRDIIQQNDLKAPDYGLYTGQRLVLPLPDGTAHAHHTAPIRTAPAQTAHAGNTVPPAATREAVLIPPPSPSTRPVGDPNAKPPPRAGRKFEWPLRGKVVSGFGAKGGGLYNDGINIAAKPGTIVRAAENGVVAYAGNELRGYGNLLLVRHSGGWITAYAHNGALMVRPGQVVKRGQPIAKVGESGAVSTPQLHFELRRGRKAVDPRGYLG